MNEYLKVIDSSIKEFQNATFFPANYIKCNLLTFSKMSSLFDNGELIGYGLKLKIDESLIDGEFHVGMGAGPTISKSKIEI